MEYVKIGKIVNTFGIRGELKVENYSDFADDRYKKGSTVYLSEKYIPLKVLRHRFHKGYLHVTFEGMEDINLVEKYKNMDVYKAKEDIPPLKEGEYFFSDIEGLDVYLEGELVGHVSAMEEGTRCNYMRVVKKDRKEALVPFLPVFVESVSLEKKRVDLKRVEGLL